VGALFIGILIFVWVQAKKANPQMVYSGAGPLPCKLGFPVSRAVQRFRAEARRSPKGLPHQ